MERRAFITATAAAAATPMLTGSHRRRTPRPRIDGNPYPWIAIEQSQNLNAQFPPGAADGTVCFIRSESSWQNGQLIVYQMHANGNTYRHNGDALDNTLSPGNWVHGPETGQRYSGIASIVRDSDGSLYGFTHDETPADIASVGVVKSDENGYAWQRKVTDAVTGQELQPDGFRGASMPSVVERDGKYVMFYTNRFGNGRHIEVWKAEADHPEGDWTVQGPVIQETGDHFYTAGVTVVWSTRNNRWMMIYSTDIAIRYTLSRNLEDWSNPRTFVVKNSQWQQKSGYFRWYGCLLDETQDNSNVIGPNAKLSEHWLNAADSSDRFPMLTDIEIR